MKSLFSLIFMLCLSLCNAQFSPVLKGKASLDRLLNSTTCIVLTQDDCVNEQLKRYFTETWELTPVQFIMEEEFESFFNDASFSFVYLSNYKIEGEKKLVGAMGLYNGGFTDKDLLYLNSSIAYITYDNYGLEKSIDAICGKIPAMVSQLQSVIQLINDNNLQGKKVEDINEQLIEIYNSRAAILKKKTLLINQRYKNTKIISVPEFESLYKYDVQFVPEEDIKKALANHESGKAVLFSSYNQFKVNKVIDCSTHKVVFCEIEFDDKLSDHRLNQFDDSDMQLLNYTVKKAKEF